MPDDTNVSNEDLKKVSGGARPEDFCVKLGEFFCYKRDENNVDPCFIFSADDFFTIVDTSLLIGTMYSMDVIHNEYKKVDLQTKFSDYEIAPAKLSGEYKIVK